jgi:hypothetical protein
MLEKIKNFFRFKKPKPTQTTSSLPPVSTADIDEASMTPREPGKIEADRAQKNKDTIKISKKKVAIKQKMPKAKSTKKPKKDVKK